jgi:Tol biopolymer transport system component
MNTRRKTVIAGVLVPLAALLTWMWPRAERLGASTDAGRPAATYPGYTAATIPPNFAPLNLKILESGRRFCLRITAAAGTPIEIFSGDGIIRIDPEKWHSLLAANRGSELRMDLYTKGANGWRHFNPVRHRVAAEDIDPYVSYRYIPAVFDRWDRIQLRQRDLRSFDDHLVIDTLNSSDPDGNTAEGICVNCHTFLNQGTEKMLVHVRPGRKGQSPAMVLVNRGEARKVDTRTGGAPAAYSSWHPSGKLLAFSRNSLVQMFHTAGVETREVVDRSSDLALYFTETNEVKTVPQIGRPDRAETFPAWAPDGRHLYFSSAPFEAEKFRDPRSYDKIQYDLVRVSYDADSGRWGEPETVISAQQIGRSISLVQISPDGHWAMFCGHAYGSFPIFQPSSDLYLVDLTAAHFEARRLDEINSARSDSYHSWSSNSRWVIFSSKREDGMFARFYIAHLNERGRFDAPLLLPQQDPELYGRTLMTYNRPEFLREPLKVTDHELTRAINHEAVHAAVAGASAGPPAGTFH